MNTVSKWAGYSASFFTIVYLPLVIVHEDSQPEWMAIFTGGCMVLAAVSGVVCLSSAILGFFRARKRIPN